MNVGILGGAFAPILLLTPAGFLRYINRNGLSLPHLEYACDCVYLDELSGWQTAKNG